MTETAWQDLIPIADLVGPPNNLTFSVTSLPPGSPAVITTTGASPNQAVNIAIASGMPGAGAPTSPDILALTRYADDLGRMRGLGVTATPELYLDFARGTYVDRARYAGASIAALAAAGAGAGSLYARPSTGSWWGADGLLKTAAAGEPRIEYDPATRAPRGFLIEVGSENTLRWSSDLTSAVYVKGGAVIAPNLITSPFGMQTMGKLTETEANAQHLMSASGISVAAGAGYVASIILAEGGGRDEGVFTLFLDSGLINRVRLDYNLASGVASVVAGGHATAPLGGLTYIGSIDGRRMYRVWVSGVSAASGTGRAVVYMSSVGATTYPGDGASGVYAWGFNVNLGRYPSSYIDTGASGVARAADIARLALPAPLASGTIVATIERPTADMDAPGVQLDGGDTDAAPYIRVMAAGSSNQFRLTAMAPGGAPLEVIATAGGSAVTFAARFDATGLGLSVGGGTPANATLPAEWALSRLLLGDGTGLTDRPPVWIKRAIVLPGAVSDAQLRALSNADNWS